MQRATTLPRLTASDDWTVLIAGLLLTGIGCAITQVETVLGAVEAVPARLSTMASGASATVRQVGSALGMALFGSVLSNRYGDALPGLLTHAGLPARISTGFLAGRRRQHRRGGTSPARHPAADGLGHTMCHA